MNTLKKKNLASSKLPVLMMKSDHKSGKIDVYNDIPVVKSLKELLAYQSSELKRLKRRTDYLENALQFQRITNKALEDDFQHVVQLLAKRGDI